MVGRRDRDTGHRKEQGRDAGPSSLLSITCVPVRKAAITFTTICAAVAPGSDRRLTSY